MLCGDENIKPLLGVTAQESLGTEIDPFNQQLKKLPAVRAGQDAPPTGRCGARGARCPAYRALRCTRGKVRRLSGVVVHAGQDAPSTEGSGVLYTYRPLGSA